MNNSINTSIKIIFFAIFSTALTACDIHYKYDPDNELSSNETSVSCGKILNELDQQALSNEHKPLNDYFKARIDLANKECPKTFQRDFTIAQLLATSEEFEPAVELLDSIETKDPEFDVKRLDLLFWIYSSNLNQAKAVETINQAVSKYPNNLHTLMMVSVNKCLVGNCKDELGTLIKVDNELRKIAVLPFLAQAYIENGDYKNASLVLDKIINLDGIGSISDEIMYKAVLSNLNIQNDEVAKSIFISYMQANPDVNTTNTHDAKAALDSLGLLINEDKK